MAYSVADVFTNGNSGTAPVTVTPDPTPGLVRGTLAFKGPWNRAKVVVTATIDAVAGFPVKIIDAEIKNALNVEVYCDSLQFDIVGGDGSTSLTGKLTYEVPDP